MPGKKVIKLNPLAVGDRMVRQELVFDEKNNTVQLLTLNDLEEEMDR